MQVSAFNTRSALFTPYKEYFFPALILLCIGIAVLTDSMYVLVIPFIYLFCWLSLIRIHWIFYILLASIPFSIEVDLPGGLATDFPDELLIWYLFIVGFVLLVAYKANFIPLSRHPISWILAIHWIWMFFTSLTGTHFLISLKFWLSKSWYLMVFYILAYFFLKNENRWKLFVWISTIAAALTVLWIETKHAASGFAFSTINKAAFPLYRNHVNYACLLVCIFPYLYPLWHRAKSTASKYAIPILALILLMGIFFAYTRAAYLALFTIIGIYPIIRYRWVSQTFISILLVVALGLGYYTYQNRYLDLAPEYTQAISHTEFDNLITATAQGKDISTMERLYRWVAGFRMAGEKYVVGFGPACFYHSYKPYTLNQFTTYVSENKEHSTIHNYYLLMAVEQGIPGLIIFLLIIFLFLKSAEQLLPRIDAQKKQWLWASVWSMAAILLILAFNDMIETDKVGSYFFINIAILVRLFDK